MASESSPGPTTNATSPTAFDPAVHLNYVHPAKRYTMAELGLDGQKYTSGIAVTEPFQFISAEGIRAIREEILSPGVMESFAVNSRLSSFQVRGASASKAPFLHALWRHPETLTNISHAAGIDLVPIMDIEFTHTNIQVNKGTTREATLAALKPEPTPAATTKRPVHKRADSTDSGYDSPSDASDNSTPIQDISETAALVTVTDSISAVDLAQPENAGAEANTEVIVASEKPETDVMAETMVEVEVAPEETKTEEEAKTEDVQPNVVGWHRDSYPWVCVIMLSDVSNSKGGETAIKQGDGSIIKVRGPQLGTAVMMQGKYIEHCALPCSDSAERLTLVCSFRARNPNVVDDSHLLTVRMCSNWNDLYYQWTTYRLRLLAARFLSYADALDAKAGAMESVLGGGTPDAPVVELEEFRAWVRAQTNYLGKTRDEMWDYALQPEFDKLACGMGARM